MRDTPAYADLVLTAALTTTVGRGCATADDVLAELESSVRRRARE